VILRLEERLNAIFAAHEAIEKAELEHNRKEARRRLLDGLSTSCLLLRKLHSDDTLKDLQPDWNATQSLAPLSQPGRLEAFLDVERDLLIKSGLERDFVDRLIHAEESVATSPHANPRWPHLKQLEGVVCRSAEVLAVEREGMPLLRRTLFAGGGALIVYINNLGIHGAPINPQIALQSSIVGWFVFQKAVEDKMKDWWRP
jgi:hypothetical protein